MFVCQEFNHVPITCEALSTGKKETMFCPRAWVLQQGQKVKREFFFLKKALLCLL